MERLQSLNYSINKELISHIPLHVFPHEIYNKHAVLVIYLHSIDDVTINI